jgi:hypothetical protein
MMALQEMSPALRAYWTKENLKREEPGAFELMFLPEYGAHEYNDRTAGAKTDTIHNPGEIRFDVEPKRLVADPDVTQYLITRGRLRIDVHPRCVRCERTDGLCTKNFCAPRRRKEQK